MLTRAELVNIALFLERAPLTGKEAYAWVETHEVVTAKIKEIDAATDSNEPKQRTTP